jgi:hypothetical protein
MSLARSASLTKILGVPSERSSSSAAMALLHANPDYNPGHTADYESVIAALGVPGETG